MKYYCFFIFLLFAISTNLVFSQEIGGAEQGLAKTDTLSNEPAPQKEGDADEGLAKADTLKNEIAPKKKEKKSVKKGSTQISIQPLVRGDLVPMEVNMMNELIYTMIRDLGITDVLAPNRHRPDSVYTLTSSDPPTTTEYNLDCRTDSCAAQNVLLEEATHVFSWSFDQFNSLTFHFFEAAAYLAQDSENSWIAFTVPVDPDGMEKIKFPQALAIDETGELLVASANSQSLVRVGSDHRVTDIVSGMVYNENLISPAGMSAGSGGTVYVADTDNHRVFSATQGMFEAMVDRNTSVYNDGQLEQVKPESPTALRMAPDGSLVILYKGDQAVRRLDMSGNLTTVLNSGVVEGMTDLALDGDGQIYVVSPYENQVFRVDNNTTAVPVAGTSSGEGLMGDGAPAVESVLFEPVAIDFDALGRMFVAERGKGLVRMIDTGGNIYTLAGGGKPWDGSQPREGTLVQLPHLTHMRVGPGSKIYVSQSVDHSIQCITVAEVPSWLADTTLITPLHIISSSGIAGLKPDLKKVVALLVKKHIPKKPIGQRIKDYNLRLAKYFRAKPMSFAILLLLASQATSAALGEAGEALDLPPDWPF